MSSTELPDLLRRLHAELESADSLDEESRKLLKVLARDLQEQRLQREMQTDAVQQIVRRLQSAKKPA